MRTSLESRDEPLGGGMLDIDQMIRTTQTGSIVTLLCDGGERYADKYYNPDWLKSQGLELEPYATQLRSFLGDQG